MILIKFGTQVCMIWANNAQECRLLGYEGIPHIRRREMRISHGQFFPA
jgi:hypothetical protein